MFYYHYYDYYYKNYYSYREGIFNSMCTFVLRCKRQSNNAEDYVLTNWKPPQFFLFSYVTIGTNYLNSENIGLN